MKKVLLPIFTLAAAVILFSCNNSSSESSHENMKEINLVILGDSLSILAPDSISGNVEIMEQAWGATEIKIGTGFQISIEQKDGDIELQKSDIEGNDVYKFQRYVSNDASLLFWEAKIPDMEHSNFHFYMIHKIGNIPYEIKDIESGGDIYTEGQIKTMIEAGQTLKKKNSGTAPAEEKHS